MTGSGAWQRVNTQVPIRSPRYAVFDLAEGKQYQFRVLSANIYGNSEPSEPTGPIKTLELKGLFLSIALYCYTVEYNHTLAAVVFMIYCTFLHLLFYFCCLQVCHLLPVRWLLPGKQTPPSSSSGLLQRNLTTWLATTLTSVWRVPRTGPQPITNLTRTPSMFSTKQKHSEMCFSLIFGYSRRKRCSWFLHVFLFLQVCG